MGVDVAENISSIIPGSKLFELGLRCDAALPLSCGPDFLVQSLADEACLGIGALLTASTRAPLCVDGHPPQLPGGDSEEISADYRVMYVTACWCKVFLMSQFPPLDPV